jgi:hypothetical protein
LIYLSIAFIKVSKESNRAIGDNSHNLVTLPELFWKIHQNVPKITQYLALLRQKKLQIIQSFKKTEDWAKTVSNFYYTLRLKNFQAAKYLFFPKSGHTAPSRTTDESPRKATYMRW